MTVTLYNGDCLEILPTLPDHSVEAIITDLPYGTTACKWDSVIPFAPMWEQVKRLLKPRGVFVTTASQPFTSALVMSNLEWFKYEWIWDKKRFSNFLNAKNQPLKEHESVLVFSQNGHTYNPQMQDKKPASLQRMKYKYTAPSKSDHHDLINDPGFRQEKRYPSSIQEFYGEIGNHPTQKPVALYEYLIRTYTNEGDSVLDICAGSGTTGVAAVNTGRNAILIEKEPKYFAIMQSRIEQAQVQPILEGV